MAINTDLSIIEYKKQIKQTRTETESWIWRGVFGCHMGGDVWEWVKR